METRTLEDFVEDMIEKGHTKAQILAIAQCTRWAGHRKEIISYGKKYIKIFRKSKNSSDK